MSVSDELRYFFQLF